jgi:hypothetical protein
MLGLDFYLGLWLVLDGVMSIIYVNDKRWFNQVGRVIRAIIGVYFMSWSIINIYFVID